VKRHLAACAAGLLAVGLWATPAAAEEIADLGISVTGASVSVDDAYTNPSVSVSNAGPGSAVDPVVTVDFGALDATKVELELAICAEVTGTLCELPPVDTIGAAQEIDRLVRINNVGGGVTGPAGTMTVSVVHSGTDPVAGNNAVTVPVTVTDPGPGLAVLAPDVYHWGDVDDVFTVGDPIPPGDDALVVAFVLNFGDKVAKGITFEVTVPEHVTITGPVLLPNPNCQIGADQRTIACDQPDIELLPEEFGFQDSVALLQLPIAVAAEAPGPAMLTGGAVTATAIEVADPPALPRKKAAPAAEGPLAGIDIDESDNTDTFGVAVAGPPPTPGGGGGGEPGLPVTGPMAGALAAGGAGLMILGGAVMLLARRRRVVVRS
jgi:LPXTG-motif cell wall-anchored protein